MVGAATDAADTCRPSCASRNSSCNCGKSCCVDGSSAAGDAVVDPPTDYGNACRSGFANYTVVDGSNANCPAGCDRPHGGFAVRDRLCHRAATATGEAAAGNAAGPCQRDR